MLVHKLIDSTDSAGRKTCEIDDIIHRDTLLKKSKYICFLHNTDGFVVYSAGDLSGVGGQISVVIYSLITF